MFKKRKIKVKDILKKLDDDCDSFASCKILDNKTSNNFFNKIFDYVNLCCSEGQKRTQECIAVWDKWAQGDSDEIDVESLVTHTKAILQANEIAFTKIMLLNTYVDSEKEIDGEKLQMLKNIVLEYVDIESKCLDFYNARYYLNRHVEMVNDVFDDKAKSVRKFFIFDENSRVEMFRNNNQDSLDLYLALFNKYEQLVDLNQGFVERYVDMKNMYDDGCSFTRKVISYNKLVAEKINRIDEYVIDHFGQIFNNKPTLDSLDLEELHALYDVFSDIVNLNDLVTDRLEIACQADLDGYNSSDFISEKTLIKGYIHKEANIIEKHFGCGEEYVKGEAQFLNQLCDPSFANLYDWKVIEHRK